MSNIFDIDKFNILEDEENYYFFRALNMADNRDIEEKITTDDNGDIQRIRTDRERYEENSKYQKDDELSLEQVFDHIKMHYRKDTNCISLSSNANVSISYGRGYYKDKYAMIKVSKKEFGQKVINAGQYMLEEIEKRINEFISSHELDDELLDILQQIDEAKDKEELEDVVKRRYASNESLDENKARMRKGIKYKSPTARISNYKALNSTQSLEKNKIIAKLTLLERKAKMNPIISGLSSNDLLIKTIGNAFASLEQIHYGEIDQEDIIKISKDEMDIISLIQQVKGIDESLIKDLKQEVIDYVLSGKELEISEDSILRKEYTIKDDISMEEMYELTDGKVEYGKSNKIVRDMFYISRAQLRSREFAKLLNQIVGDNPKYKEIIEYIRTNGFSVEPEIITRQSNKGEKISESVSLDIKDEEIELKDRISKLEDSEQEQILEDGGLSSVRNIMKDTFSRSKREEKISKEEYYAEAMFSLYDWKKLGIEEFTIQEKSNLINRIKEKYVVELYEKLEKEGIDRKNIPQILMNIITRDNTFDIEENDNEDSIKEKRLKQYDKLISESMEEIKENISIERIERFLGYYDVENTGIRLRPYQQNALDKVDEIFETERFSSVILPTGGGKSFVALAELVKQQKQNEKLIKQGKEPKKMLYLAPQNEILEQIKDDIIKYIHGKRETIGKSKEEIIKEVFPNLEFNTYSSLIAREGDKIIKEKFGFIVLDELHRTGAKEWGDKLNQLLENQDKDLRVLGITATPRRDADGKDMSIEIAERLGYTNEDAILGKHIAMNMSLTNAIRMGLVVNPKLVSCQYNLANDGSLDELRENIESIEDIEKRNEKIDEYEKLRRNLDIAKGIPEILKENIKQGGRYFVFLPVVDQIEDEDGNQIGRLKGKKKIEEYEKQLMEYFKDSDIIPSFHSMLGEYGDKENQRRLEEFQSESGKDSKETKFMLVMNKANEGLHLEKLDGMIWLRPLDENSRILYLQQLGRVIYSENPDNPTKDENRPVVIDLVNNTLKVNWDNEITLQDDIELLTLIINWTNNHDGMLPDINSNDKEERGYAKVLRQIQEKYKKYLQEGLENLEEKQIKEVNTVIELGESIDLWQIDLPERLSKSSLSSKDEDKDKDKGILFGTFEINSVLRDFVELKKEVKYQNNISIHRINFQKYKSWCEKYHRLPRRKEKEIKKLVELGKNIGEVEEELRLAQIRKNFFSQTLNNYKGLTDEEKQIKKMYEELDKKFNEKSKSLQNVEEYRQWCEEYHRLPRRRSSKITEMEEVQIEIRLNRAKEAFYAQYNKNIGHLTEEEKKIKKIYEELEETFKEKNIYLQNVEEYRKWCEEYHRLPREVKKQICKLKKEGKNTEELEKEYKLCVARRLFIQYCKRKKERISTEENKIKEIYEDLENKFKEKSIGRKNAEEYRKWCEKHHRLPKRKEKVIKRLKKLGEDTTEFEEELRLAVVKKQWLSYYSKHKEKNDKEIEEIITMYECLENKFGENKSKYKGEDLGKAGLEVSTQLCDKVQEELNKTVENSRNKEQGEE